MTARAKLLPLAALLLVSAAVFAQFRSGRSGRGGGTVHYTEGGVPVDENTVKTAREVASHSTGTPNWTNAPGFEKDAFTFVRIIRDRSPFSSGGSWITDFPDSDLNLSYRVQQMTSLKVDPNGRAMRLTNPDLFNYPWIYMVEVGSLELRDEEVPILRKYLLNGGFLMVDDFWGETQYQGFYRQLKRVFPEREPVELAMDHPIFHSAIDIKLTKQEMQVPNSRTGERSQSTGVTWEYHDGEECKEVHFKGVFDDKGRMMVFIAHNTDNGDGWEREGENEYFFREFSEKKSFPLGINVIFYSMTH